MKLTVDQVLSRAVDAHKIGKLLDAERLYQAILKVQPKHPDANHNLGVLAVRIGKPFEALPYLMTALETNSNHDQFWISYINALIEAKQVAKAAKVLAEGKKAGLAGEAVKTLEQKLNELVPESNQNSKKTRKPSSKSKAGKSKTEHRSLPQPQGPSRKQVDELLTSYNTGNFQLAENQAKALIQEYPNHHVGWKLLGAIFGTTGRIEESLEPLRQSVRLNPHDAEAYNNLGNALRYLRRFAEAEASYREAIRLKSDYSIAHSNLGVTLQGLGRLAEAEMSYREVIHLKPDHAIAHNNLGNALRDLGRPAEAEASCREAISLKPDCAEAYNNLGNALRDLSRLTEAEASYREAIRLKPDCAEMYNNLGATLSDLGRPAEAEASYRQSIHLKPGYAEAHRNLGVALKDLRRFAEAEASYGEAIHIKPDFADAYWNKSVLLILTGQYLEGWKLYEWRLEKDDFIDNNYTYPELAWRGQTDISDKTILIHSEQGLGDFIQFCRYVPLVKALGAEVILETPKALAPLVSTLNCLVTIVEKGKPLPSFDVCCPVMSLPYAFRTTVETIPGEVPYLFSDPQKVNAWEARLGDGKTIRVGLVWSGSKKHKNDRNRSIPLEEMLQLTDLPIEWHSLQKDYLPHDQEVLDAHPEIHVHREDFANTAALIDCLDLVISVDTSIAHVAGALGKPVWILLPYVPDYRWMLDRDDSPWYPTARLFRQPTRGDWTSVLQKVRRSLINQPPSLTFSSWWVCR